MHGKVQVSMAGTQPVAIPHAWLMLVILSIVNLFNFVDRVLFSVMLEPIKLELKLTDSQMGLIGGAAFGVFYGVASLVMGRLADTRSRVGLITSALGLWSAASAACGQVTGFTQMFVARAAVGSGVAGCSPSAHSLIGDYFPPERRALALSVFTAIGTLGTMVGLIAGGVALDRLGWRSAFLVFGLAGLIFAPLAYLLLREPSRGTFDKSSQSPLSWGQSVRILFARRTVRQLLMGMPMVMASAGIATWIPALLQRAHGASAGDVATYGGLSLGLGIVGGTLAGGVIVNVLRERNRLWEFWWPALATGLSVPLMAMFYVADNTGLAYALLFLGFFAAGSSYAPALACMLVVAEPRLRGTMVALNVLATSLLAYGLAPAMIGIGSDLLIGQGFDEASGQSLRYAMMCALALPAIGVWFFLRAARTAEADSVR